MKALAPLDDIFALGGQRGGDGLVSEAVSLVVLQCRYAGLECLFEGPMKLQMLDF